ncbi:hypothetical protein TorRG33x02_157120 [Trema orientale]|uniref:Uncharacterized protein n=1 Tax=Trema orientale TaxID=63057 RepID=A0A2P5ESG6_TREOI|nr:hypothetical protein TorRG33x02_157120 [Trema orientale]
MASMVVAVSKLTMRKAIVDLKLFLPIPTKQTQQPHLRQPQQRATTSLTLHCPCRSQPPPFPAAHLATITLPTHSGAISKSILRDWVPLWSRKFWWLNDHRISCNSSNLTGLSKNWKRLHKSVFI